MATYDRLTALDTSFLLIESPRTPMHVAAVLVLDAEPLRDRTGRFRLGDVQNFVSSRLHLAPRMRQVVREVPCSLGRPVWVDDPSFDVADHVRLMELPAPGDDDTLYRLVAQLMMNVLDRSRPLWEWWIIDGLPGGRVALLEKMHHCLIDGVSGVQVMAAMTDLGAFAPPAEGPWRPAPAPSGRQLLTDTLAEQALEPWKIGLGLLQTVRHHEATARLRGALGTIAGALRPAVRAPTTSLNRPVGRHRVLRHLRLPIDELKAIGRAYETKLNDPALTIVAGGLRTLLLHRGEEVAGRTLHALVPENLRQDHEHLTLGNRVTGFFAPLPVHQSDPVAMLCAIRDEMRAKRAGLEDVHASDLLQASDHLPYLAARLTPRLIHEQPYVNTVVTNVPGPREELTIMGARIEEMVPIVPLGGNLTIGVALLSYRDAITFGVNADAECCPDIDVMLTGMRQTFDELRAAAGSISRRRGGRPPRG